MQGHDISCRQRSRAANALQTNALALGRTGRHRDDLPTGAFPANRHFPLQAVTRRHGEQRTSCSREGGASKAGAPTFYPDLLPFDPARLYSRRGTRGEFAHLPSLGVCHRLRLQPLSRSVLLPSGRRSPYPPTLPVCCLSARRRRGCLCHRVRVSRCPGGTARGVG